MTRQGFVRLLALVGAAWFAGCAGNTCGDPARAGFFDGIGNLATDCYGREEARLNLELAMAQARRDALRTDAMALEQRAGQLAGEGRALTLRVAATERSLAELSGQLDTLSSNRNVKQAELARLRAQEAALATQLRTAGRTGTASGEVERLEASNTDLRNRIGGMISDLGKTAE